MKYLKIFRPINLNRKMGQGVFLSDCKLHCLTSALYTVLVCILLNDDATMLAIF